jgi:hypothetical protein
VSDFLPVCLQDFLHGKQSALRQGAIELKKGLVPLG